MGVLNDVRSNRVSPRCWHSITSWPYNFTNKIRYILEDLGVTDRPMRVSRVHQGFVLELFSEWYPKDSVSIPLHKRKVIVGMDCLSPNREIIDCEHQLV